MPAGQPHSDETKAAVLSALLAGQSVTAVAQQFHLSRDTVRAWRSAAGLSQGAPAVSQQKRAEIGELLIGYLREVLTTLRVQQRAFREKDWLAAQSASELAVLHGVSFDKAVRLLEALQSSDEGAGSEPGESGDAG
jgi:transposase-like protein